MFRSFHGCKTSQLTNLVPTAPSDSAFSVIQRRLLQNSTSNKSRQFESHVGRDVESGCVIAIKED